MADALMNLTNHLLHSFSVRPPLSVSYPSLLHFVLAYRLLSYHVSKQPGYP